MRIDRLDLLRYGHFTDARLHLPAPQAGQPDLHVVYGPNEAGKSTLLAAWLDLLFGMPHQTPYNFLHDNRALRIEAQITAGGVTQGVARIKGNANTLRDVASDQPLPEAALAAALGGLDRAAYATMFSLDDDTLEKGGESILASQGDLGQLLFAASAGLADLSEALRALREESSDWFRPGGRKFRLTEQKARLAELAAQRRAVDLQVSDWRRMREALSAAEQAYSEAGSRRAETQARLEALRRDLDALPRLARLRKTQTAQADLPPPEALPQDWPDLLAAARRDEAEIGALRQEAARALAEAQAARAALPEDPAALEFTAEIEVLEPRFGAIAKEQADLPRRREELGALEAQMASCVAALARDGLTPRMAALPPTLRARLGVLAEDAPVLQAAMAAARNECARAKDALRDIPDAPVLDARTLARLGPMMAELRRADLLRALSDARATRAAAQAACAAQMARLAPWAGSDAELGALDLPVSESLQALERARSDAAQTLRDTEADCERLAGGIARLRAEPGATETINPDAAAEARASREAAWAVHRQALSDATAQQFEQAMRADDKLQAVALEQARMAERLVQVQREKAALAHAQAQRGQAQAALAEIEAQIVDLWARITPAPGSRRLTDLIAWADQRRAALDAIDQRSVAEASLVAVTQRLDEARAALRDMLSPTDAGLADADYATLLAEGEALVQSAERMALQARLRADHAAREADLNAATEALANWRTALEQACAECWIGTPAPDLAELRVILSSLAELATLTPQADALARRIARIEEDTAGFHADLIRIAQALDHPAESDPLRLWPGLRARLRNAAHAAQEDARLSTAEQTTRGQLATLETRAEALAQRLAPLRERFGAHPLDEMARRLDAIMRATSLAAEAASQCDELATHLGCTELAPELDRLATLEAGPLRAEAEGLAASLRAQDQAVQTAYAELVACERARDAAGQDGDAARLEAERQTLLLDIGEEARRYLARQAGILAVEQALRLYRDTHRSGMMAEAARAFAHLTGGRYAGLATRPEGAREILIAQMAGGAAKPVDTLSKGTRFQLYLALRAAGYLELAHHRPSVPFVADDIMETFDDTRARAAFGLLAQMGMQGQVIYLTHHAHLCEIARAACPDVQVHDLSALTP